MTAADRQRRRRERRRSGRDVLPVECDVGAVASMLVDAGLLPEWDAENRQAVAAAYSRVTRALSDIDPDRLAVLLRHA